MAPSKRGSVASSPRKAAKKAKTEKPELPLLDFIKSVKELPKPCRDMLVAAVPHCLEVVEADRHKFESDVLARVEALVRDTECKKRDAVSALEAELAQVEGEKAKAFADAEAKKMTATGKQNECDEKGKVVDGHREVVKAAQDALTAAQKEQEGFDAKKTGLFAEQENFAKLLAESFQPLKDGSHTWNGSQRNKQIGMLKKKLLELGAQESLADAMAAALKDKPEKREGAFAKATMQFSEELFAKHTAKVAQDIAGLDAEAAGIGAVTSAAEADLAQKKEALDVVSKEWDAMQDQWLSVEKESAEAAAALKRIENEIPDVTESIETAKAALEKFLEIPALFLKLKEHSTAVHEEPAEEAAEEAAEPAAAEGGADEAM